MASPDDLRAYESIKEKVNAYGVTFSSGPIIYHIILIFTNQYEDELSRRKTLGQQYSRVLATQLRIIQASEERRKTHRIQFDALYREAMKSMEWMNALTSQTSVDPMMIDR